MAGDNSNLDAAATARARALLTKSTRPRRLWPVVAAAALLAAAAIGFAVAMVLAPPIKTEHVAESGPP